jgi:translocation and assembly module TamB
LTLNDAIITIPHISFGNDIYNISMNGDIDTSGTLSVSSSGTINLGILDNLTDFFSETRGTSRFDLNFRGAWEDPDIFGDMYIQEFFSYLPLFNTNLEDYHANVRFNQKIGRIMYMEGLTGGSYLGGRGEFGIDNYLPELFDLTFSGNDVELEYPRGFQSTVNIDIGVTGNLPGINISGLVDIRQSMYSTRVNYKTMIVNESRAKLSFMERRPTMRSMEDYDKAFFNPIFNVTLRAPDGILIDNNIARVEMSLRLDILGTLLRPRVLGHIDVLRGEVTFLQRNFELLSASIDFADPARIDPLISLQAGTTIDDYRVNLDISGNLYSDLNIRPSSTPPLNEIDLWNLLVIGKTRKDMASSDDYLAGGVAYVTGSLQEQIERRFEYWIGFDEFSIDAVMSTYDESPTARFTAKKRFGPDLSVLYSRSATSTDDLLLIEYKISDNLFVIGHKKEDNSIGADIRYRWEFD